jgi:tetratricopeptide (TPR) repeat protein
MILRDEEKNLERSLAPVAELFDEAVVVDTGSLDQTRQKARSLGARVKDWAWNNDFAAARNCSIQSSKADYLFWLDGDNQISPRAVERLRKAVEEAEEPFIGWCTEVLEPGGERLLQKRLFPRRKDVFFQGRIHEQLIHPPGLAFRHLEVQIRHWGYADPGLARAKGERNMALLEKSLETRQKDFFLLYQAGRTLMGLRKFDQAETFLARAVGSPEGNRQNPELYGHAWVLFAQAAERNGRPDLAEARLDQALEAGLGSSGQGLVCFHLGRLAAGRADWSRSVQELKRSRALGLDFLSLDLKLEELALKRSLLLARGLEALGREEEAMACLTESLEAKPDNPLPFRELTRLLIRNGRLRQAGEVACRLLERWPSDPVGLRLQDQLARPTD